jgi:lipopolysaccharide transport system permease protein
LSGGAQSLVGSQGLISKVYFPRLVIPMASVATPLVDAGIAMVMLFVLMAWFGIVPPPAVVLLPLFGALAVAASAAAAVWLSALGARYRDVRYVIPFLTQFWLFVTPVAYPTTLVPGRWRAVYGLNPMATVVDGVRWTLLDTPPPAPAMAAVSCVVVAFALWTGLRYFQRSEAALADVL